jgi:hypothetical protein
VPLGRFRTKEVSEHLEKPFSPKKFEAAFFVWTQDTLKFWRETGRSVCAGKVQPLDGKTKPVVAPATPPKTAPSSAALRSIS